jgi:hypothetical protein
MIIILIKKEVRREGALITQVAEEPAGRAGRAQARLNPRFKGRQG